MNQVFAKQLIERAIKDAKWIKIDYVSKKLEITTDRLLEPYQLDKDKDGNVTAMMALDLVKDGVRRFDLEGIQKLEVIDPNEGLVQKKAQGGEKWTEEEYETEIADK